MSPDAPSEVYARYLGLCFAGLTASNVILIIDLMVVPDIDLFV